MYCQSCGSQNNDNSMYCTNCGRSLGEAPGSDGAGQPYSQSRIEGRPDIPNYLIPAILVTILCCMPTGIVSIVYAAQVNGKIQAGDIDGARRTSGAAKTWAWVSFGFGLGILVLYAFFGVAAFGIGY